MYFFTALLQQAGDLVSNLSPAKSQRVTLDKVISTHQTFKLLLPLLQIINILVVPSRLKVN